MSCIKNCKLCDRFTLSQAVTFTAGTLTINLPAGSYGNDDKYCIVIAQAIPDTVTINSPVVFTIGTDTTTYPFVNKCCEPVLASQLRTRRVYPTLVSTSVGTGVFKYIGQQCLPTTENSVAPALPIPAPVTGG